MLVIPQEYAGSLCEIKSLTNDLLAVGRVIKIDHEALEIAGSDKDRIPLLQYRLPVKIFVINSKLDTQILVGITYLSTENFVRVEEVKPLQDFERRGAFRVYTSVPGRLYPLLSEEDQAALDAKLAADEPQEEDVQLADAYFEVKVMDVSLTGVRLQSAVPLQRGAKFFIEFVPLHSMMGFCLQVQRIIRPQDSGSIQYGCHFIDYSERQLDGLCRELFQMQRIEKNRRRNAPPL